MRTKESYMVRLFAKMHTIFQELENEDKEKNLFEPKLFEDDKEIFNLSLLITLVMTSPTLRSTLRNNVDWNEMNKVNWDDLIKGNRSDIDKEASSSDKEEGGSNTD